MEPTSTQPQRETNIMLYKMTTSQRNVCFDVFHYIYIYNIQPTGSSLHQGPQALFWKSNWMLIVLQNWLKNLSVDLEFDVYTAVLLLLIVQGFFFYIWILV